jgi:hypothetical protein
MEQLMSLPPPEDGVLPPALVAAWRADVPSRGELQRGFARFLKHRPERRAKMRLSLYVAIGVVLGAGLAQAAGVIQSAWQPSHRESLEVARPTSSPAPTSIPSAGLAPPVAPPVAAPEPATDAPEAAPSPRVTAASIASARQLEVQRQWQRVAQALRQNDFDAARVGLLDIERSVGGAERDAARMARAQLLASHGHSAEALELARPLADGSSAEVTREQARTLVERLTKNVDSDRSTGALPANKRP